MNTPLIARLPALLFSVVMTFGVLTGIDALSSTVRADAAQQIAAQAGAADEA